MHSVDDIAQAMIAIFFLSNHNYTAMTSKTILNIW